MWLHMKIFGLIKIYFNILWLYKKMCKHVIWWIRVICTSETCTNRMHLNYALQSIIFTCVQLDLVFTSFRMSHTQWLRIPKSNIKTAFNDVGGLGMRAIMIKRGLARLEISIGNSEGGVFIRTVLKFREGIA